MDKEQLEIQSLGLYAIFRVSFTITLSWRKLFTQITIATIFPLSLLFLGHAQISEFLFAGIVHNEEVLHYTQEGSSKYANILDTLWSEQIVFWLFKALYFILFLVLSLLSTSAVVYTVACIYTTKETTFGEVMRVVPKVWKRVMVTFAWSFIIVLVYNLAAFSILVSWLGSNISPITTRPAIWGSFFVIYMMGFVYISIIWHLASVVSVLEEDCGIEAMMKSMALVKGKMAISVAVFMFLNLCFMLIQLAFQRFVVLGESFWGRIGCGILCFFLLSGFTLLGLTIQTLIYLVCKLYHHEIVNKSYLANHLEVYLGDYAPLRSKDVQFEQV
ncbi:hypothetical protein Pfo_008216 [Paulownia fortunei]|nr:hypothetical protein Pfo_008216 [Paulownia fortunei]